MGPKKFQKNRKLLDEVNPNDLLKPGRHPCLCESAKHALINNCLSCGRIVCEQEGAGPCFTCETYVLPKDEREFLLSNNSEAIQQLDHLRESGAILDSMIENRFVEQKKKMNSMNFKDIAMSVFDEKEQKSLEKAQKHKDMLLEYDRNSVARTKVYDDQVDYFTLRTQNFISDDKRKQIGSRIDHIVENKFNRTDKLVLDLETGTVTDTQESVIKDLAEEHRKLQELSKTKTDYKAVSSAMFIEENSEFKKSIPEPLYLPVAERPNSTRPPKFALPKFMLTDDYSHRVQDKEQDILDDKGMCLAMRQPYASLLVAGIKRFEGRSWYSPFKGRLWIYAAAHRPTTEEIDRVENFYRQLGIESFPRTYPTAAMIGCVIVEDCLPNSVYSEQHPECEIDSPYAFICTYPIQIPNPISVNKGGGDKIYSLQPQVHRDCRRSLGI